MGLESTLLAIVSSIIVWVVQRENGGAMNMVLRPISNPSNETDFEIVTDVLQSAFDFLVPMILYRKVPLPVLAALPESLEGGPNAVSDAQAHPNGEPIIFWCTIGVFVVVIGLIIAIQVINCCCCCCRNRSEIDSDVSRAQRVLLEKSSGEQSHSICRLVYIVLLIIAIAFGVSCIILIGVYFGSTSLAVAYLENQPGSPNTTSTLPNGVRYLTTSLTDFLEDGISGGQRLTNGTITSLLSTTEEELSGTIHNTIVNILEYLGASTIESNAETLLNELTLLENEGEKALAELSQAKRDIEAFKAKLDKVKGEFTAAFSLITTCGAEPECAGLQTDLERLQSPIDPNILSTTEMDAFLEILTTFTPELRTQFEHVQRAVGDLKNAEQGISDSLKNELDIKSHIGALSDFWGIVANQTDTIKPQLDALATAVEEELPIYVPYIAIGLYVIGGIFTLLALIGVLIVLHLVYRGMTLRIFSSSGNIDGSRNRADRIICGKGSVCICSALFIPILIIFTIIIAVFLFALSFISGEACVYIVRQTGINKVDFVVNGLLAKQWPSIIGDIPTSRGGLPSDTEFLNLPAPRNVLHALKYTCKPSVVAPKAQGLLGAVGYTNIIDFPKLIASPAIQEAINNGGKGVVQTVADQKLDEKLPTDADLQRIATGIDGGMAAVDLSPIIMALDTSTLDRAAATFLDLTQRLDNFIAILIPGDAKTNLASANTELKELKPVLEGLKPSVQNAKETLDFIQSKKGGLSTAVESVIAPIEVARTRAGETALKEEVSKEYEKVSATLLGFLETEGNRSLWELTQELFPCGDVNNAVTVGTEVTCGDLGIINRLTGVIYVLSITVLFIMLFYFSLFNLAFVHAIRVHQLGRTLPGADEMEPWYRYDDGPL